MNLISLNQLAHGAESPADSCELQSKKLAGHAGGATRIGYGLMSEECLSSYATVSSVTASIVRGAKLPAPRGVEADSEKLCP